eukprot:6342608-Prymnesium_polylepis.1
MTTPHAAADPQQRASEHPSYVALDAQMHSIVLQAAQLRAKDGVLVPLFANVGFMSFLRNVLCSIMRLNVDNWLVVAMDNRTCDTLGSSFSSPGSCVHPYVHQPLVPPGRL